MTTATAIELTILGCPAYSLSNGKIGGTKEWPGGAGNTPDRGRLTNEVNRLCKHINPHCFRIPSVAVHAGKCCRSSDSVSTSVTAMGCGRFAGHATLPLRKTGTPATPNTNWNTTGNIGLGTTNGYKHVVRRIVQRIATRSEKRTDDIETDSAMSTFAAAVSRLHYSADFTPNKPIAELLNGIDETQRPLLQSTLVAELGSCNQKDSSPRSSFAQCVIASVGTACVAA